MPILKSICPLLRGVHKSRTAREAESQFSYWRFELSETFLSKMFFVLVELQDFSSSSTA